MTTSAELTSVAGRALGFAVELHDEAGAIRSDTYRRGVITTSRFNTRVTERARDAGAAS